MRPGEVNDGRPAEPAEPFPITVEGGRCVCRDWKAVSRARDTEARNKDRAFLAACGIRFDDDIFTEGKPMDDELFRSQLAAALAEEEARLQRVGKVGPWCFRCGRTGPTSRCDCPFPLDFGCVDRLFCEDCRKPRREVADFLRTMFAAKITQRSNSVRAQRERALFRASGAVCNPSDSDDYDPCKTRDLHFWLAQADPFDDSAEEFETKTLRAFRRSRFLDFAKLATEIKAEQDKEIYRALARALRTHRPVQKLEATCRCPDCESFYK